MRLGINIDHVATVRNARGGVHPSPLRAAQLLAGAGVDLITAHLREDRRHIRDADMQQLRHESPLPLNMEMAVTEEMLAIACALKPHAVCLVPERREELTTEGGLNVVAAEASIRAAVQRLQGVGIQVALFIDPEPQQVLAASRSTAHAVEFHTGTYAHNKPGALQALQKAAAQAHALGLELHAGHGLTYDNVAAIAAIPHMVELNIGHFLIGEALFGGLVPAVQRMKAFMG